MHEVSKNTFFPNTVFYYTTPIRGYSAHWIITLFVGKSLIMEAQNHKISNKSAEHNCSGNAKHPVECQVNVWSRYTTSPAASQTPAACTRVSALTVVGWRLLLLLPTSDAAAIGGPVVVVLLLVFYEDLPQQLLWRGKRLSGFQLKPNRRHKRWTQWMVTFWDREEKKQRKDLAKLKWRAWWERGVWIDLSW